MYEWYIKIAHFGRIFDKRQDCLQIRQAWKGWLSRKFICTFLRNLIHDDTVSDKVELSKWCDFCIGFGVVGTDSCCWKAVFMLTTSEVCVVILMIYEQKKKSTAVLSILLTLNLILWKTHCKDTKWYRICKIWPWIWTFYNYF